MGTEHHYKIHTLWTGNLGQGTSNYRGYSRNHEISAEGKALTIPGSSDPAFRGDATRFNPEELLVSTLSTCHMLWVLHLCAEAGIVVLEYSDSAEGTMVENEDGAGEFQDVVLHPKMVIADETRVIDALVLHDRAHKLCFIARSVKFAVSHKPVVEAAQVA